MKKKMPHISASNTYICSQNKYCLLLKKKEQFTANMQPCIILKQNNHTSAIKDWGQVTGKQNLDRVDIK